MMACCELCGAGDDLENMFEGSIETENGTNTHTICYGCAHNNIGVLKNIIAISALNKVLKGL